MKLRLKSALLSAVLMTMCGFNATAGTSATHYFWVVAGGVTPNPVRESFVVAVDQAMTDQINNLSANGAFVGFSGSIAAGSVAYNKNYFAPTQPVWNWHVTAVLAVFDLNGAVFPACQCPYLIDNPSEIAADPDAWITANGNTYTPIHYQITAEINPNQPSTIVNVSSRGFTGQGAKTLITGFIIRGGEPRNVIIRGLGPSLTQQGVPEAATNPKIQLFVGSAPGSSNTDWKTDKNASVIMDSYPLLAPHNEKEAALYRTLLPGEAYTIHTTNEDSTDGVVLTEVYDATLTP